MAIIRCSECKRKISDQATVCIHCGFSFDKTQTLVNTEPDSSPKTTRKKSNALLLGATIGCFVMLTILFLYIVAMPFLKYRKAVNFMETAQYQNAITIFESLGDYKDSTNKIIACIAKTVKAGDYIVFGEYEQDNNTNSKEEIEWLVLEVKDGKALVISKYALDCKQYNIKDTDVTWETCSLRTWLNNGFINSAFSTDEKAVIPTVTVSADTHKIFNADPGDATQDQIFLLSSAEATIYNLAEVVQYSFYQCVPTDYAVANGVDASKFYDGSYCAWWLRTPGHKQCEAALFFYSEKTGQVHDRAYVNNSFAVRPALWIDLDKVSAKAISSFKILPTS